MGGGVRLMSKKIGLHLYFWTFFTKINKLVSLKKSSHIICHHVTTLLLLCLIFFSNLVLKYRPSFLQKIEALHTSRNVAMLSRNTEEKLWKKTGTGRVSLDLKDFI